jgi:hypothetical protein
MEKEKFVAMIRAGRTTAEIAEEFGVAWGTARRWAREQQVVARREVFRSVRERAEDMTPGAAVPWLLDMLELLHESMCGEPGHEVDGWAVHLTPAERRLMICLLDRGGTVRSEALHAAVMFNSTLRETDLKLVTVMVCKIRRKLPAAVGRVETVWGHGYRFVRA